MIIRQSLSNLPFLLTPFKKIRTLAQPNFGIGAGWRAGVNLITLHCTGTVFLLWESVSTFLFWYGFFLLLDKCVA